MIDLHSHLLPGIDDGSEDWDESLQMARQAVASGTTQVVITHHILDNTQFTRAPEILAKCNEMRQRLARAGINLQLHLASEVFYQHDIVLSSPIATFNNNGRYFLVEFPMQGIPRGADEVFFRLICDGKIPVIAHPERNLAIVNNPSRAYEFVQRGALLQLNAGSLTGSYGERVKDTAVMLMNSRLIHFIGSDGHNTRRRPMTIGHIHDTVCQNWGEEMARGLFYDNPKCALAGDEVRAPEPLPVQPLTSRTFNPIRAFKRLVTGVA